MNFDLTLIIGIILAIILFIPFSGILFNRANRTDGIAHIGKNKQWFIQNLANSKELCLILSGELHPNIFDDEDVLKAIEEIPDKVKLLIIGGPTIGIKKNEGSANSDKKPKYEDKPLFKIIEEKENIEMYVPKERINDDHFTIVDQDIYIEKRHNPFAEHRYYSIINNSVFKVDQMKKKFYLYLADTDLLSEAKPRLKFKYA